MQLYKDLYRWIDNDGLVGSTKNPTPWSTGNAILETSFAIILIEIYSKPETVIHPLYLELKRAVMNCKSQNGLFNKNPNRPDQITHDDLIGAAVSSVEAARIICRFGIKNNWIMSNTGKIYWNAISRPHLIAFYKYCSGLIYKPTWWQQLLMDIDLMIIPEDPSSLRIHWLKLYVLSGFSDKYFKLLIKTEDKIKKKYGYIGGLMADYYQDDFHIFSKYFP